MTKNRKRDARPGFINEVKKLIELYPGVEVVNIGRPLDEWEIKC